MSEGIEVSTIWLGLDHSFGFGPPLIFETIVFVEGADGAREPTEQHRYATETEALVRHDQLVDDLSAQIGATP